MVLFESTVIIVYEEGNHEWNIMNTAVQPLDPSSPGTPPFYYSRHSYISVTPSIPSTLGKIKSLLSSPIAFSFFVFPQFTL